MYRLVFSRSAANAYKRQDTNTKRRLNAAIDRLAADPYWALHTRRLAGELAGLWRCRVGEWRIIYELDDPQRVIRIVAIVPRSKAY